MSKKMKRTISLLICTVFMIVLAVGCQQDTTTTGTAATTTKGATTTKATTQATTTAEEPPVTITTSMVNVAWNDYPDNPIAQYLLENLNIKIEVVELGERKEALMASGDLPDLCIFESHERGPLIESGFIIPMDEYLDQYGQDIKANAGLGIDFSREYWGDGSGKLYCLTGGNWYEPIGTGAKVNDFGLNVNWQLYEQLGYPEVENNWDSVLDLVKEMVALQPQTADGQNVYGIPAFSDWGMWGHVILSITLPGRYSNLSVWSMVIDDRTTELVENYTNPESPLWQYIEFLYKENQAGIFDTDSLIASFDDLGTKATNGQYVASMWGNFFSSANQLLNAQGEGYATIPVKGGGIWGGPDWRYGAKNIRVISAKAERPDKVMQFLNWCYSTDGMRIQTSGLEGVHWDYVDGVPTLKDDVIALKNEAGEGYKETGIFMIGNFMMSNFPHPDGYPVDLWSSKSTGMKAMTEFDKKVASHYGVDTVLEHFEKLRDTGAMIDQSKPDMRIGNMMPTIPDDLSRINSEVDTAMNTGLAQCILSANDGEFETNKASLIQQVTDLGVKQVTDWFTTNYEKLRSELPPKE